MTPDELVLFQELAEEPRTIKVSFLDQSLDSTLISVAFSRNFRKLYGYPRTAREVPVVRDVYRVEGAGLAEAAVVVHTNKGRYMLSRQ